MAKRALVTILALMGFLVLCAPAQALVGEFYLGGSVGQATLEEELTTDDFTDDDTAFRGFAGYRLTLIPIIDFAVEAGYRDLGEQSDTVGAEQIDLSLTGYDLTAMVIYSLGPLDLFLKAGALEYDLETSVDEVESDYDGTAALYGAGVGVKFWKLGVRAEYEYADVDELDDSNTYWLGVYYRF